MFKSTTYFVKTITQLGTRSIDHAVEPRGVLCMLLRKFHITSTAAKQVRYVEGSSKKVVVGTDKWKTADDGNKEAFQLDLSKHSEAELFPDFNTPDKLFDGVPFKELPSLFVKATPNNTLLLLKHWQGKVLCWNTCGIEGFKNCRKATNVAAQQTATSLCKRATAMGVTNVKVLLNGIGPGRLSALKGIQIGGLNIVSVTDNTRISWCPPKPRKRRRL